MRGQAALGSPLALLQGYDGFASDDWVILKIEETKTELEADGARLFDIAQRVWGDAGGFDGFGHALAAISTLAWLA